MAQLTITFYECENFEDLNEYISDIQLCGGRVLDKSVDHEEEIGRTVIEVDDLDVFKARFACTSSSEFTDLS